MKLLIGIPVVALLALGRHTMAQRTSIGQMLSPKGRVVIVRGASRVVAVDRLRLQIGDQIVVPRGGGVDVRHFGAGKLYRLAPQSVVDVRERVLAMRQNHPGSALVAEPLVIRRVPTGTPTGQPGAGEGVAGTRLATPGAPLIDRLVGLPLRGASPALDGPYPVGGVADDEGLFRWRNDIDHNWAPAGTMIRFAVIRDDTKTRIFAADLPLSATSHVARPGTFLPGVRYRWEVVFIARGVGRQATGALFWILGRAERARAAQLDAAAARKRPANAVRAAAIDLRIAGGYARLGLYRKAHRYYQQALRLNPKCLDSPGAVARKEEAEEIARLDRRLRAGGG